jgi:hypothetical protein
MKSALINLLALTLAGCVSVSFGPKEPKRARDVRYTAPGRPFAPDQREEVDAAWKNAANGNLISFISDCQDDSDPTLDAIVEGALDGLADMKIESTQSPRVQGREGRRVLAAGKVDGVPSKIDLLAFKRNRCIYIVTYVGVQGSFSADHQAFDAFIEGFRAP